METLKPLTVPLAQWVTLWLQTALVQLKTCCAFHHAYSLGAAEPLERAQNPIAKPTPTNSGRGTQAREMQFPICTALFPCGLWVTSSWHSPPKAGNSRHWLMVGNELSSALKRYGSRRGLDVLPKGREEKWGQIQNESKGATAISYKVQVCLLSSTMWL